MDSKMERELDLEFQVSYHEWILNEVKAQRDKDHELSRKNRDSSIDSAECLAGWVE